MGPDQNFLTRVGLVHFFVAWVASGFGKFPLKVNFFHFRIRKNLIGLGQKIPGSKMNRPFYLLQVKSMFRSGEVPSLPHAHIAHILGDSASSYCKNLIVVALS